MLQMIKDYRMIIRNTQLVFVLFFMGPKRRDQQLAGLRKTHLERWIILGDLQSKLIRDGYAAVLQGDKAEVGQAGGVCRVPGCSQDHQASSEGKSWMDYETHC